ncbi:MAG: hypothetical protein JO356_07040 [Acidobacteria bacterium]|nr:hypothetical protein [Acidobacteriota bacterium]
MKKRRKKVEQHPENDLAFIPPIAEHVQYIELAHTFMARDPDDSQAPVDSKDNLATIQPRKKSEKSRADKAA